MKEEVEMLNSADNLIFQSNKTITDMGDKISEEDKEELNGLIEKLKDSHSKKEMENVKTHMDDLNTKLQSASQKMYENVSEDDGADIDSSDVEFEEVD